MGTQSPSRKSALQILSTAWRRDRQLTTHNRADRDRVTLGVGERKHTCSATTPQNLRERAIPVSVQALAGLPISPCSADFI